MIRNAILLILLVCSPAWAGQGMGPGPGVKAYSSPSGYSDSFTNTNDTPLATHNSNWASASATYLVTALEITSNAATGTTTYANGGAYHTASTSDISQIVFKALTNTTQTVNKAVGVRMDGTSLGYNVLPTSLSGGNWTALIIKKNTTGLGTACTGLSISAGTDHTIKIKAEGTATVTVTVYVDGTQQCQRTDSSSTIASGHPGFYVGGNGTIGNNAFDDWQDYE